jgi:RNA polymerase sigma-70 factor (ECF subfamily)
MIPDATSTRRLLPAEQDAAGSSQLLEYLYRQYRDVVRRYVVRTFGQGPPDPDDVVQAAFERFATLEQPAKIDNPQAFLVKSARNYVIDQRRRLSVRASYRQNVQSVMDSSDDLNAERVLSAKERWEILERAIRAMDPRRQEVLIMHRINGLSYAEIARRKGLSQTMVKTLVAQALVICERALREADAV